MKIFLRISGIALAIFDNYNCYIFLSRTHQQGIHT